ncbi:CHAD domain-containing protein [Halopseudomonas pachastrellae]|nr:CHAD domain-containing protein [Halopseudomonas pachastrellae]
MTLKPDADPLYLAARQRVRLALLPVVSGSPLDADTIHQLRVCCKRLRALLQLYRRTLAINACVSWISRLD